MSRPRAADDFAAIRARMEDLRRERDGTAERAAPPGRRGDGELERRRRIEGRPPPWAPRLVRKTRR